MKIGYQALRKISKYFEIFLGIQISHQTNNYTHFICFKQYIKSLLQKKHD